MNESVLDNLKTAYTEYLSTLSIGSLRLVGRHSGVSKSTLKKKGDLIVEIVAVLTGEVPPAEKNNRGAPVKDDYVDPKIFGKLEEIKLTYLASLPAEEEEQAESSLREAGTEPNILDVRSPEFAPEKPAYYKEEVYSGQLETLNGVSCLLPLDGRDSEAERIIVTVSMIKTFDLREGDIVACHAEKHHAALIAGEILSVNGLPVANGARAHFEDLEVCYPKERIFLYREKGGSEAMKYIDWLVPFGKGQRALVTAAPKTGKTTFLKDIAKAITETHPEIRLLVLLTDQSPESVGEFKKIVPKSDLVYTTFDDDAEKHVFMANFLLKRAKRFAEAGMDVLLLVDSLTNLAHAYGGFPRQQTPVLRFGNQDGSLHPQIFRNGEMFGTGRLSVDVRDGFRRYGQPDGRSSFLRAAQRRQFGNRAQQFSGGKAGFPRGGRAVLADEMQRAVLGRRKGRGGVYQKSVSARIRQREFYGTHRQGKFFHAAL